MWSGTKASIPTNWALCDGTSGTPNLRNQFVIAANDYDTSDSRWETTIEGTGKETGGSKDAVIVAHDHDATSAVNDPQHAHTFSSNNDDTGEGNTLNDRSNLSNTRTMTSSSNSTGITVATTVDQEGVAGTNKNLPPYFALAYIMRTS